jgi:hypothetical protein
MIDMTMGSNDGTEVLSLETEGFHILQDGGEAPPGSGINQKEISEIHQINAAVLGVREVGRAH